MCGQGCWAAVVSDERLETVTARHARRGWSQRRGPRPRPATAEPVQVMASSSCTVGTSGNRTTAVVGANASGHFINIFIDNE
jgi:hypothetical protein